MLNMRMWYGEGLPFQYLFLLWPDGDTTEEKLGDQKWHIFEWVWNQPYASIYAIYSRKLWQRLPIALRHPSGPRCVYPQWQRSWARATWKPLWWNWQLHPCGTCGIPNDLAILQALWVGGSPEWAYLRFLNVQNPVNGLIFYKAIKKTLLGYSTIPVSTWAYFLNIGIQLHLVVARSDLPRALHIVCTEDSKEQIYDVQLALPGESQVTRIRKKFFIFMSQT